MPLHRLSQPDEGNYRPSAAEILYTDAGMTGEVPIGQFDPYGGTGTGLLGAISNRTLSIKVETTPDPLFSNLADSLLHNQVPRVLRLGDISRESGLRAFRNLQLFDRSRGQQGRY